MENRDPRWMIIARSFLGVREVAGPGDNKLIAEWLQTTSIGAPHNQNDETPWCAAFVNAMLRKGGIRGTGRANALSYLTWGEESDGNRGDVCVMKRGADWDNLRVPIEGEIDTRPGHVGFVEGMAEDGVVILGGNQGDAVSYLKFPFDRVLGYRKPGLEDRTYS